jgi:hypothetical protein
MRRHWLFVVLLSAGLGRAKTVPRAAATARIGGRPIANVAVGLPMTSAVDSPLVRAPSARGTFTGTS